MTESLALAFVFVVPPLLLAAGLAVRRSAYRPSSRTGTLLAAMCAIGWLIAVARSQPIGNGALELIAALWLGAVATWSLRDSGLSDALALAAGPSAALAALIFLPSPVNFTVALCAVAVTVVNVRAI